MKYILTICFVLTFALSLQAQNKKKSKKDYVVIINTKFGEIHLLLYEDTPLHRENFLKLAEEGFYNDLLFHRVIANFMIQGGDPESKDAPPNVPLGSGGTGETIPAEINPKYFHKKGALAAARMGDNVNPERKSSGCQFYIVQGNVIPANQVSLYEQQLGAQFTEEQKTAYTTVGGTPHLDGAYTVFGEVLQGIEVVDTIGTQITGPRDRPKEDIKMEVRVEKMSKKKITKIYGYEYPEE